jgi:hypothetical protein
MDKDAVRYYNLYANLSRTDCRLQEDRGFLQASDFRISLIQNHL